MLVNNFFLYGLVFKCPLEISLPNCPFTKIRKLPILERVSLLENMSTKQLLDLEEHHKKCYKTRTK